MSLYARQIKQPGIVNNYLMSTIAGKTLGLTFGKIPPENCPVLKSDFRFFCSTATLSAYTMKAALVNPVDELRAE